MLYAPLSLRSKGALSTDVNYSGKIFSRESPIEAEYKFNSYRFTYRYMFITTDKFNVGAGITGKIRDANITLRQPGVKSDFPDLGFVPLVNFYASYRAADKFLVLLEGDALGSGQGRAEDIFLGAVGELSKSFALKAGLRVLEGGADVEKNYNFTWINYIAVGTVISF